MDDHAETRDQEQIRLLDEELRAVRDERDRLRRELAAERERCEAVQETRARLRLLSEVSAALAESIHYEVTLRTVARLATTHLADYAMLDLLEEDGQLRRLELSARDPARLDLLRRAMSYPPLVGSASPVARALEGRRPILVREVSEGWLDAAARDEEHRAILDALAPRSLMLVPLVVHGRSFGILNLVIAHPARRYDERDLAVAEEIGRRAAFALENARLYRDAQRAEAEARALAERLARTVEILEHGDACFVLDKEWRFVLVNENQERLSRMPRAETLGKSFWELFPPAMKMRYWTEYHRVRDERVPCEFEEYYPPYDIWTNVTAYPTREGGIAVFFRDTTAQRKAEQRRLETEGRLQAILDHTPAAIYLKDLEGRYLLVNPGWERFTGMRHAEAVGRSDIELFPPAFAEQVRANDARVAALGESVAIEEVGTIGGDGRLRAFFSVKFPLRDPAGALIALGGISLDITDRKRMEEALRETVELLRQEVEVREMLMGVLAHDLRNSLGSVTFSAAALLQRPDLPEGMVRSVQRVASSGRRMEGLIYQLLDFTRARSGGGMPIDRRPANLHEICRVVVEEIETANPGRRVALGAVGDGAGAWDPDRLGQVASNLVGNAVTYSPLDSPVEVRVEGAGDRVILSVHNQGPPIPPDVLPTLFDPFRRGRHARSGQASAGLGLGLYITDQIVRAHGGAIEVRSEAGAGTTFTVTLPREPAPAAGGERG
uniref:histidine kinase n=1 Tax=Jahnella sp. MSr9139 TaxID=1434086 RepID=A0A4Y5T0F6_9BACT|nr:PAS/PAC sensor signal transduction histidine kinase [Jahnella sp. MSr9139]